MKLYKYTKITDNYTTYAVQGDGITEICDTADGQTIISVADDANVQIPEKVKLAETTLDTIKTEIKEKSYLYKFLNEQVKDKIREKYSVEDELQLLRKKDTDKTSFDTYNAYVEQCVAWGADEKKKLGMA